MTTFRERIQGGAAVSGPIVGEIRTVGGIKALANAGHDFVWLDMEHAMYNWETIVTLVQYARAIGITPLVRVTDLSYALIARALDSGAIGVIVPRVNTVDEVEEAVGCAYYPPLGRRGAGGEGRVAYERRTPDAALAEVNNHTVVAVQIETMAAVEQIDAIAAVNGVDIICVGPQDLSISLGLVGQFDHPTFVDAVTHVMQRVSAAGKTAGMVERDARRFERWHKAGCRFFACNTDMNLITTGAMSDVQTLRGFSPS
ncbi:MAG TPA: aldolase/citrate lyase family protein [Thermomicrobiales bacterium]|nr:aldolase/citrate lyase family protein [Thermomicrobiales bacterium]